MTTDTNTTTTTVTSDQPPWVLLEQGRLYTFEYTGRNKERKTKIARFQRLVVGNSSDFEGTWRQAYLQCLDMVEKLDRSYILSGIDMDTLREVETWEVPALLHKVEQSNRNS